MAVTQTVSLSGLFQGSMGGSIPYGHGAGPTPVSGPGRRWEHPEWVASSCRDLFVLLFYGTIRMRYIGTHRRTGEAHWLGEEVNWLVTDR
jgi:hypothetical protein